MKKILLRLAHKFIELQEQKSVRYVARVFLTKKLFARGRNEFMLRIIQIDLGS